MKQTAFYIGLFFILCSAAVMAESEDGGYAGAFLNMALDARPAAMGGAYIGISDDASGQLYNPAGVAAMRTRSFSSAYRMMKLDRKLGFVSLVLPTRLESSLGISWIYAGYGEVTRRNSSGQDLGSTISSGEHAFAMTFAKQFSPVFSAGTKLNYYYKYLDDISEKLTASSVGINLGVMMYVDSLFEYGAMEEKAINDIKIGLVLDNLSAQYSWGSGDEGLRAAPDDAFPVSVGLGVSFRAFNRQLLLAVDGEKNLEQDPVFRFGGEYLYRDLMTLRAGLDNGHMTFGTGFPFKIGQADLFINYAFADDRVDEGSDHLFSLQVKF